MAEPSPWITADLVNRLVAPPATTGQEISLALSGFLEVLDSVDRLVDLADAQPDDQIGLSWRSHLVVLRCQMLEAFERAGVTLFEDAGQLFDPSRHQAVATQPHNEIPDYTIVDVVARGCAWRGQVLRYSRVVVARNLPQSQELEERAEP